MKIKTLEKNYEEVLALQKEPAFVPKKPNRLFRKIMKLAAGADLKKVDFSYDTEGMDKIRKDEPCIILMNHSCFLDLGIAATVFADRPFNIVCTSDGFVGKKWLMRQLGCIPTQKFVTDMALLKHMKYALHTLKSSVLLYPEASYSFDGCATPLPESVGKCIKVMGVPVVMVRTYGAFQRDPLYNNLQVRDVKVSATVSCLMTADDIKAKSVADINAILAESFSFDNFKWQQENHVKVNEPFRADFLHRVLYKCPHCNSEESMIGKGIHISCSDCGASYELTDEGYLNNTGGDTIFNHVPNWYNWQRENVRQELSSHKYSLDLPVRIGMLVDTKAIYFIGNGTLRHNENGFVLKSDDGRLEYKQVPKHSYSLYSDYYWYEIGDMICIGDKDTLYYCFPTNEKNVAAKARIAAEEMYRMSRKQSAIIKDA